MIADQVRAATKGKKKMTIAQLVQAMEEPATEDLRGYRLLPTIFKAIGKPKSADAAQRAGDAARLAQGRRPPPRPQPRRHRRGNAGDRADGRLVAEAGRRRVQAGARQQGLRTAAGDDRIGDHTGGSPDAPDFYDGWWGYVSKDLRDIFGPKPKGALSRVYCGGGSKSQCRKALQQRPSGGR